MSTTTCECDCACGEPATERNEGKDFCAECSDYSVTPDGDVRCSRVADVCPGCDQKPTYGPIQTGPAGAPNRCEGECGCTGRAWRIEDRGGWTVPTWSDDSIGEEA